MRTREGTCEDGVTQAERQVLRALCQGTAQGSVRESARLLLKNYRWRDPVHGVLFETLANLAAPAPEALRSQLPALLTRRGFPDVAWEDFFSPHGMTKEEAEELMRRLK
jgi:hypothetical protein